MRTPSKHTNIVYLCKCFDMDNFHQSFIVIWLSIIISLEYFVENMIFIILQWREQEEVKYSCSLGGKSQGGIFR